MLKPKGNSQELHWSICTPSDIPRICPTTPALPQAEDPPAFPLSPIFSSPHTLAFLGLLVPWSSRQEECGTPGLFG